MWLFDGTRFVNPDLPLPEGSRIVINPRVAFPFQSAGWFVIPRAQLSATYYSMERGELPVTRPHRAG